MKQLVIKSDPKTWVDSNQIRNDIRDKIGQFVLSKTEKLDNLILVGKLASFVAKTAPTRIKIECVKDWQQAQAKLQDIFAQNSKEQYAVLFKASNAVGLHNIVKNLS